MIKKRLTIQDFLPEHEVSEKRKVLSVKVKESLIEATNNKREKDNRSWTEIIEASLMAYTGGGK